MPQNGLNTGKDVTLVIVGQSGTFQFNLTGFTSKQMVTKLKSRPLNGKPLHANIPDGWGGDFRIDRINSNVDDAFAVFESNYFNGIDNGVITITETIAETSGYSQYRYDGVQLELTQAGNWTGETKVEQTITWEGSSRVKLA
jgi:hypothetical protein